ncbi:MAG: TAXI family TRAP transporter solute-binding subunit [Promethearchaeota archaeon]
MKRIVLSFLALFVVISLVAGVSGCGAGTGPASGLPDKVSFMIMTTVAGGGASAVGIAAVMERETGSRIVTIPVDTDAQRHEMLSSGAFDWGHLQAGEWVAWLEGQAVYLAVPRNGPLAFLWVHNDTPFGFMVRGDSELDSIYDIKTAIEAGKEVRMAAPQGSPLLKVIMEQGVAAFLGIDPSLLTVVPLASYGNCPPAVVQGDADVCFVSAASPIAVEAAAGPHGIDWLSVPPGDAEGWARFQEVAGLWFPINIEYGVEEAIGTDSVGCWWLFGTQLDQDEELVYNIAKFLYEDYDAYKGTHPASARTTIDNVRRYLDVSPLPTHPGTIKYLKEIGYWTDEDDAKNEEGIKLQQRYIDAWDEAKAEAEAQGIKIAIDNEEWKALWNSYIQDIPRFTLAQ